MSVAGTLRVLRAGMVVVLTLIGSVSCTSQPDGTASFVRHEASARVSPRLLVPFKDCVFGIADGLASTVSNWVGDAGCTRLVPSPGEVFSVTDAVPMDDGSIIGVGKSLVRRDPDGSVQDLPALPAQLGNYGVPSPYALARSGQRLIVVGRFPVYDKQWDFVYLPTAWESTDGGVTVHQITLPLPQIQDPLHIQEALGLGPSVLPMRIAADGDTVLATDGYGYGSNAGLRLWRSVDGGHTWSVISVPLDRTQAVSGLLAMLRASGRWLLIFQGAPWGSSPGSGDQALLVLSSADGAEWGVETGLNLGSGWVTAATHDRDGNLVLIGTDLDRHRLPATCNEGSGSSQRYACRPDLCAVAWTGPIGKIVRRNLECAFAATGPAAVTTLADGRVLIVNGAGDLWIRQ